MIRWCLSYNLTVSSNVDQLRQAAHILPVSTLRTMFATFTTLHFLTPSFLAETVSAHLLLHLLSSSPILHLYFTSLTLQLPQSRFSNQATCSPRSRKVALQILDMLLHDAEMPGPRAARSVDYFHAFAGVVTWRSVTLYDLNVFSAFCFAYVISRPTTLRWREGAPTYCAFCRLFFLRCRRELPLPKKHVTTASKWPVGHPPRFRHHPSSSISRTIRPGGPVGCRCLQSSSCDCIKGVPNVLVLMYHAPAIYPCNKRRHRSANLHLYPRHHYSNSERPAAK